MAILTADDESNAWEISFLKDVGYHAMGHDTYRVMAGFWPVSNDSFSDLMNSIPKLVFTRKGLDAMMRRLRLAPSRRRPRRPGQSG